MHAFVRVSLIKYFNAFFPSTFIWFVGVGDSGTLRPNKMIQQTLKYIKQGCVIKMLMLFVFCEPIHTHEKRGYVGEQTE